MKLAPLSAQATTVENIGSPKFADKSFEKDTFTRKAKDQEEVMYEAVMEHMEEDDEDMPDTLVSRLTKVIHD